MALVVLCPPDDAKNAASLPSAYSEHVEAAMASKACGQFGPVMESERYRLPQDVLMDINTIQNSGSSLLGIINDILDFSKIETGKFEINEAEYMLPSVLMDVSNVISVRLSGRPVYFLMDIDPALPNHFVGDDIRIKQILLNLIGNSVKFTQIGRAHV